MDGRRHLLDRLDLEILDAVSREWQSERLHAAQQDRLLRDKSYERPRHRPLRILAIALAAAVAAALLIGLAAAGADSSAREGLGLALAVSGIVVS